jgi:urease accessory protein
MESASLVSLLTLADSRLPAGGHAHSGGVEPAMATGLVSDLDDLTVFLRGRLRTAGLVAAAIAAATCLRVTAASRVVEFRGTTATPDPRESTTQRGATDLWRELDAETDARTASPAQRAASRQQGRALLRAGRAGWPAPFLHELARTTGGPHHAVALGAVGAAARCTPDGVAHVAAYLAVSGPAAAAVRLRGYDPFAVHAMLAGLTADIEGVASVASAAAAGPLRDLPCNTAPRLDLLAEVHINSEVRLFAS